MARDEDDRPRRRRYDEDDDRDRPPLPRKSNAGLIIGILVGVFVVVCGGGGFLVYQMVKSVKAVAVQATQAVADAQARMQAENDTAEARDDLKKIGLALHNYDATFQRLPNDTYGLGPKKAGRPTPLPLLSWRVHILPYIGHDPLYKRFKLDEAWDSAHNRPLVDEMPDVYGGPAARLVSGPGKTFYRGFCHEGAVFEKPRLPGQSNPITLQSIKAADGPAITLMVVESAEAIEWTRPDELDWSPGKPRPKFGGSDPGRAYFLALTADGQVRRVRMTVPDKSLRDLITRADGMVIQDDWEHP